MYISYCKSLTCNAGMSVWLDVVEILQLRGFASLHLLMHAYLGTNKFCILTCRMFDQFWSLSLSLCLWRTHSTVAWMSQSESPLGSYGSAAHTRQALEDANALLQPFLQDVQTWREACARGNLSAEKILLALPPGSSAELDHDNRYEEQHSFRYIGAAAQGCNKPWSDIRRASHTKVQNSFVLQCFAKVQSTQRVPCGMIWPGNSLHLSRGKSCESHPKTFRFGSHPEKLASMCLACSSVVPIHTGVIFYHTLLT